MITHTVFFKLKHDKGSEQEKDFFNAAQVLAQIPGVLNFETVQQTSSKNNFDYGFTMQFSSQGAYQNYNNNPAHVNFVNQHWTPNVADFLEIDYEPSKH